nr:aminopeptidase P family N-terminal domain-containing protein [Lachnospiraceae bacterium]
MNIETKLELLRNKMKTENIDLLYVTTADEHCSEYIPEDCKEREYISGFTGSNGDFIITENEAILWTDGRYFLQADEELSGTEIKLYKMGIPGFPKVMEYIVGKYNEYLEKTETPGGNDSDISAASESSKVSGNSESSGKSPENTAFTVAFNSKLVPAEFLWTLKQNLNKTGNNFNIVNSNLISDLWAKDKDNPKPDSYAFPAYEFETKYCGEPRSEKLGRVRTEMKKVGASHHIISSLDDINWLLNIRGCDIKHNPVVQSFVIMSEDSCKLFINPGCINDDLKFQLSIDNIEIYPYDEFYSYLRNITSADRATLDNKSSETVPDNNDYPNSAPDEKNSSESVPDEENSSESAPDEKNSSESAPEKNNALETAPVENNQHFFETSDSTNNSEKVTRILLDMKNVNAEILNSIIDKKLIFNSPNPEVLMKAVKNE